MELAAKSVKELTIPSKQDVLYNVGPSTVFQESMHQVTANPASKSPANLLSLWQTRTYMPHLASTEKLYAGKVGQLQKVCRSKRTRYTKAPSTSVNSVQENTTYQQLSLEEQSKNYVVINTHKGLFRYTRLPFGISSAPGHHT